MIGVIGIKLSFICLLLISINNIGKATAQTSQEDIHQHYMRSLKKIGQLTRYFFQLHSQEKVYQLHGHIIGKTSEMITQINENMLNQLQNIHQKRQGQQTIIRILQQQAQQGCNAGCIIGYIILGIVILSVSIPFLVLIVIIIMSIFNWIRQCIRQCRKHKLKFPKWQSMEDYNVQPPTFDKVCCICLDNIFCDLKLGCDHSYHLQCLTKWLQRNKSCPTCRKGQNTDLYYFCPKCQSQVLKFEGLHHLMQFYQLNKQKFKACSNCKDDIMNPEEQRIESQAHIKKAYMEQRES